MMTGEKERERVEVEGVGGCRTRRRRWRAGEREEGAQEGEEEGVHRKLESWEKAKEGVVLGARASRRAQAPGFPVPSHSLAR